MRQVRGDAGFGRVVAAQRFFYVQMMPDGVFESGERSIVKKRGLERSVAKRRTAELVTIVFVAGDLLQAEILILVGTVKDHIPLTDAEKRRDLRDADVMHLEIAEHLVGPAVHSMTGGALALAEENQR